MKRWYANYLMRWAFRVFHRYHEQLPKELYGVIWGEMTRKLDYDPTRYNFDSACSTCVRELKEDQERQEIVRRWLKGKRLTSKAKLTEDKDNAR